MIDGDLAAARELLHGEGETVGEAVEIRGVESEIIVDEVARQGQGVRR
jgi:hypothetical protein